MNAFERTSNYEPMTLEAAVWLAAPQTWAAALSPVLTAGAYVLNRQGSIDGLLFYLTLAGALLMQSAANTLNDYYDYKKGTDNGKNSPDPKEAVLVYRHLAPRTVLMLAAGFLGAAAMIGLYVTSRCGWIPMGIGCIGGLSILLYSGGLLPLSYLPVGEIVSGTVMGGLLPLAVIYVLMGRIELLDLYFMVPLILGVGLIMFTNNISDIEKDKSAGRRTLSVYLGRKKARYVYIFLLIIWILSVGHMVFWHFRKGFFLYVLLLGFCGKCFMGQMGLAFLPDERKRAMGGITRLNLYLGLFYAAMILADGCVLKG